ncbi:unnamed protein product [Prorocentrum cordatum]|uniref:EF-hand domain-containing protein n=1 Tax=Prorocentrum cordatum TaxID=2364126 RepID=A0ABN9T6Z3_9DINO|nr:unnamed protein product [Polarella glacialis]
MAALQGSASLMQGDFLDGVVEATLRGMVGQLKAEYRRELRRALAAADPQAPGLARAEAPRVPPLHMPAAEFGDDHLRSAGGLLAVDLSEPPVAESAGRCTTCPPPPSASWLSPRRGAWRESRTTSASKNTGSSNRRSRLSSVRLCDNPIRGNRCIDKWQGRLSTREQEACKSLRDEEMEHEESVFAKRAGARMTSLEAPAPDEASRCRMLSYKVVASSNFDFGMGIVIIINAFTIGMETSISRHGHRIPASLHFLEYAFVILYCIELLLRVCASGGRRALSSHWVKFDAAMVAAGILNFLLTVTSLGGGAAARAVDHVNILKVLRLCRLVKTVRVIVQFRTLWMLVQGLMYAVLPMFWTEAKKAWKSVRRKILMPKLRSIFFALDTSGDGEVDREELLNAPPDIKEAIQHIVGLDELEEVFSLMDYDGSGVIDIEEFVDGIMRSQADKPSELFVLVKQGKAILDRLQGLEPRPAVEVRADGGAPRACRSCEPLAA